MVVVMSRLQRHGEAGVVMSVVTSVVTGDGSEAGTRRAVMGVVRSRLQRHGEAGVVMVVVTRNEKEVVRG